MAEANSTLIEVLNTTADRIESGSGYRWTHQGKCNCGQLVQTATGLGAAEIHRRALQKLGEWTEHANDYCPYSSHPMDQIIHILRELGFEPQDLADIEHLSNPEVLSAIQKRHHQDRLNHKSQDDVVLYFRTWAELLHRELSSTIATATTSSELVPV